MCDFRLWLNYFWDGGESGQSGIMADNRTKKD